MKTKYKEHPSKTVLLVRTALPFGWATIVSWLSLTSTTPYVPEIFAWDKLQHAGAYAVLAMLVAQFCLIFINHVDFAGGVAIVSATAFGAILELMQWMMQSGRSSEWSDVFANAAGAVLGYLLFRYAVSRIRHKMG